MRYMEFKDRFKDFTVVSYNDIVVAAPGFHRARLNEWQAKGYIKKVIKGQYVFSGTELSEQSLYTIANRIYKPSYVSLEMALSYYHLIPESVYRVTSITTRKTYRFRTPVAEFSYRTVKPSLFFGYDIQRFGKNGFSIACPEKALLDYLYLNPQLKTDDDFEGIRIDTDIFKETVGIPKMLAYASRYGHRCFSNRVDMFLRFAKNA